MHVVRERSVCHSVRDKTLTLTNRRTASADRRPVDPPPIVELQIFEGEGNNLKDITFQMNASYFLFTTLQPARTIAPMRGQPPQDKTCVLTGTPVAGMVYLDRPQQAGYFIFPDLSVRHEGTYRLSFNLYEELKDPKDADRKAEDQDSDGGLGSGPHVTHRMEVFSQAFNVYSAKKFPGLSCSTDLSRMVAEQGCRVRIRKEARLRKRKEGGAGYDGDDDHQAGEYAEGYGPNAIAQRPRSDSAGSHHSPTSMPPVQDSRRISQNEMPLYSQSFVPPPGMQQQQQQQQQQQHHHQHHHSGPYAQPSYGSGVDSHYSPGYHQMTYPATQSQMPPPPPQMQHSGYGQPPTATHSHQQQHYYGHAETQHQPSYLPAPPLYDNHRHHSYDSHASQQYEQPRPQPAYSYSHPQPAMSNGLEQYAGSSRLGAEPSRQLAPSITSSAPSSMTHNMRLPPIQTNLPPTGLLEPSPISAVSTGHYSSHNTDSSSRHASTYGSSSISSMATPISKRTHSDAFVQNHQSESLYDGQRPSLAMHGHEGISHGPTHLSYRRADGTEQLRAYDTLLRR